MKRLMLVLLVVLLVMACSAEKPAPPPAASKPSTPPPPSTAQARELLASAPEFSEYEFTNAATTIPMQRSAMNEPALETAKQLQKAGWIRLGDAVELTGKAKNDKRFLVRPNGFLDIVPLAKKELGEVTAVRANPDGTADADFDWKWIPNEVGAAFTSGPLEERYAAAQSATATLIWDGSAWSVLKIVAQGSPR